MLATKTPQELSETEWTVYHAAVEASHAGARPSANELKQRLPEVHGETVRRTRTRLARWGILEVEIKPRRSPVAFIDEYGDEPTMEQRQEITATRLSLVREYPSHYRAELPKRPAPALHRIVRMKARPTLAEVCREIISIFDECGVAV